ncbi:MAG: hypothetical protein JWM80_4994 [Cyanobacteria bacterium RYN_339]|nr:hypothetical protein [Cyanobacteria bacterium RYN_339]
MFMRPLVTTSALALACVLAGCPSKLVTGPAATGSTAPGTGLTQPAVVTPTAASKAVVTGTLSVPAGIVAAGAGNIVASGAGNIVASGAGNLRGLLDVKVSIVAGAKVYLADAAGNPIPNLASVKTDANGKFTIPDVPPGFTFMVAAEAKTKDGKTATFQTLTKSTELGATADISPSTALVTAAVVRDLKNGDLGSFNPSAFRTAAETTAKNLAEDKLPDFSSRADVLAKMDVLIAAVGELKQSLDQVKQDLADIKQSITDLQKAIETQKSQPTAAPGQPTPTPDFKPTPDIKPSPDTKPTPTPAPGATNVPGATPTPGTATNQGCGAPPQDHYFRPLVNGNQPPAGWKLIAQSGLDGSGISGNVVDASGTVFLKVPAGCPMKMILQDPAGGMTGVPFGVDPNGRDTASNPIVLTFQPGNPPPTATPGPTGACSLQPVRLKIYSRSGVIIKRVQITINDGSAYSGDVGTDGFASLVAPAGCPLEAYGFDVGGNRVGPIHLAIVDPKNPPPFELP